MDEKNRFVELSTEEIQEITDNATLVTNNKVRNEIIQRSVRSVKFPLKVAKFQFHSKGTLKEFLSRI